VIVIAGWGVAVAAHVAMGVVGLPSALPVAAERLVSGATATVGSVKVLGVCALTGPSVELATDEVDVDGAVELGGPTTVVDDAPTVTLTVRAPFPLTTAAMVSPPAMMTRIADPMPRRRKGFFSIRSPTFHVPVGRE